MEKILEIKEVFDFKAVGDYGKYDGYIVKTDKREIRVLIDNSTSCCEDWGYLTSEDDLERFLGSELVSFSTVSGENFSKLEQLTERYIFLDSCIFVEFQTSVGFFQLVVYNEHNGYYSHSVIINQEKTYL